MSLDDVVANDYGQMIILTVKDTDTDQPADISDYSTTIQIQLKNPSAEVATKTAEFVTDGADGQVKYTLADGDIDASGTWYIRAKVASATAVLSSAWLEFTVLSDT